MARTLGGLVASWGAAASGWAQETDWVRVLSAFRGLPGAHEFDITVSSLQDGVVSSQNTLHIIFRSHQEVLVLFREPSAVLGRKILISGHDMYLALPSSARVLRILPSQRLLGDASNGDVVNADFAEYELTAQDATAGFDGKPALKLSFQAQRGDLAYQRIDFYVDAAARRPLGSEHFTAAGKSLKSIRYLEYQNVEGRAIVKRLRIRSALNQMAETEMVFSAYRSSKATAFMFKKDNLLEVGS